MVTKTVTVMNAYGFHMRPAMIFAAEMGKFSSRIKLQVVGRDVDGKSLMNIIAACIKCGTELTVCCEGDDEQAALDRAVGLIESGLGEA